ncbi:MAG: hypothetical protein RIR18_284 [Pseudomonadota bacterium]|jgi:DNA polymerase-3 subunit chi
MPNVFFYHNAQDKWMATCNLLRKAAAQGKNLVVFSRSQGPLDNLDRLLWTFDQTSFVPHCRAETPLASQTPIVLTTSPEVLSSAARVLNLDPDLPPNLDDVDALIEVVGQDDEDRIPARARFRAYKERGYNIQSIDLSEPRKGAC